MLGDLEQARLHQGDRVDPRLPPLGAPVPRLESSAFAPAMPMALASLRAKKGTIVCVLSSGTFFSKQGL